jgi:hypothetical protein
MARAVPTAQVQYLHYIAVHMATLLSRGQWHILNPGCTCQAWLPYLGVENTSFKEAKVTYSGGCTGKSLAPKAIFLTC